MAASFLGDLFTRYCMSWTLISYCRFVLSLSGNSDLKRSAFDLKAARYCRGEVATPSSMVGAVIGILVTLPELREEKQAVVQIKVYVCLPWVRRAQQKLVTDVCKIGVACQIFLASLQLDSIPYVLYCFLPFL